MPLGLVLDRPLAASDGSWAACDVCHALIEHDNRPGLLERSVLTFRTIAPERDVEVTRALIMKIHAKFFEMRIGKPVRLL